MTPFRLALVLALSLTACQPDAEVPPADAGTLEAAADDPEAATGDPVAEPAGALASPLNLNTATEEDLAAIPDLGDRMVHEFMEYRPYASIREFRREIGKYIDDDAELLAEYERYVFVPVDPETSDLETMTQLPGVSEAQAKALIDGRPYSSRDAFLTAYASIAGQPDATAAEAYLVDAE